MPGRVVDGRGIGRAVALPPLMRAANAGDSHDQHVRVLQDVIQKIVVLRRQCKLQAKREKVVQKYE